MQVILFGIFPLTSCIEIQRYRQYFNCPSSTTATADAEVEEYEKYVREINFTETVTGEIVWPGGQGPLLENITGVKSCLEELIIDPFWIYCERHLFTRSERKGQKYTEKVSQDLPRGRKTKTSV